MPPPQITTLLLLLFITTLTFLHNTTPQTQNQDLDTDCTNKYIHIRHLPPQFNTHLLTNCSNTYHPFFPSNLCQHIPNQGLGPTTHNTSHSWFRTDPTLLEHFFHTRMLEYPCLTNDPTLAHVIYVPYYTVLDSLRYLYGDRYNYSDQHGLSLYEYLAREDTAIWDRHMGHDHFLVLAGSAWDYIQPLSNGGDNGGDGVSVSRVWGSSFLEMGEFFNVTVLVMESRAYPFQEMSIPYMTSFHPPSLSLFDSWVRRVRGARRPVLMMFAGGGGISTSPNVRRSIRLECEANVDLCEFVDCSNGICEHDPIKFMKPMLRASFCLQPPGDTPTRRSTFDSILAGCIPVFFEELSAKKQYVWHLPEDEYDEFSVMIPKEDVVFRGVSVVEVLKGIPKSRVRKMRKKLIEMIPRIVYRRHGSSLGLRNHKDAFDIAVEGTIQRIKARLESLGDL
nr:probable xyloglucan galactosyltransferase GT19 [Tanacetum cinerariifolium]